MQSHATLQADPRVTLAPHIWQPWFDSWRWMETLATARAWNVVPLHIKPPATEAEIRKVEADHGVPFPTQLRDVLTTFSSSVTFGWYIPKTDQPGGDLAAFYGGGIRDFVWDLAHIDEYAISNFLGWKEHYFSKPDAEEQEYEEPNPKEMWEHQFPIAALANGDMLTIDCNLQGEPVRYFSHEIEGLHGRIIAPDFVSFVTEYAKLGCLGGEQIGWLSICDDSVPDATYGGAARCDLRANTAMAKRWLAWLKRDPSKRAKNEAPRGVFAKSAADLALHTAAQENDLKGVTKAIKAGANVNCVLDDWHFENMTALCHAASKDNCAMMTLLAEHGAEVNTKKLPLTLALEAASVETVRWLIERGSRVDGWEDDRHWPLHTLIVYRKDEAPGGDEAFFAMLTLLLEHGADPNAPWDNGITMLMQCGPKTAACLLAHGADPTRANVHGYNALHWADSTEMIALLVTHGVPINAYSTPRDAKEDPPCTALHYAVRFASTDDPSYLERIEKLIALGADCSLKDGQGRTALQQCQDIDVAKLLQAQGESLTDLSDEGWTVLQVLADFHSCRLKHREEFVRYATENGVNVNATDKDGKTVLHWAAKNGETEDVALLLAVGADKTLKDASGKRPLHYVKSSQKQSKSLLK